MSFSDVVVIAHAGVGRRSTHSIRAVCKLCEKAAHRGRQVAYSTRDPTVAVVEAVRTLEESPLTNAGIGSNVNRECTVECDASLIEGWSQRGGSVGAVPSVPHAILIAHKMVLARHGPACLVGPGALDWFRENGGRMPEVEVITNNQRKMFAKYRTAGAVLSVEEPVLSNASAGCQTARSDEDDLRFDTVGAVALVGSRITAGVSSGGTFLKPPGRVGQAGVYGAGCWADHTAGVSTSGTGEHLIRTMLASRCVAALGRTQKEDEAGDEEHGELPPAMKLKGVE
ncbi:threonine aspartase 1-like [Tropilaelaps mercedesae]|uniref:Threonine aspartase 1-like n=1 Tax=Tropilaelaps mercedesae TaxID=418985 RepID=A0A1V9XVM0_9ACAR|nr:threonine aspartase 1-like [Tropilaelaps mercedesae]